VQVACGVREIKRVCGSTKVQRKEANKRGSKTGGCRVTSRVLKKPPKGGAKEIGLTQHKGERGEKKKKKKISWQLWGGKIRPLAPPGVSERHPRCAKTEGQLTTRNPPPPDNASAAKI